ncbi:MAG TPA: glycosyltransferase family 2 protein [Planctomycetota bacterium]|nr:glycosyltransferase family 2 protein [Planctomycetota bacterium]
MTETTRPELSVVVLSYDRPEMLGRALASLDANAPAGAEIIVIDNHSPREDEVSRAIAPFRSRIQFVRTARNLGFTGGMNEGIRRATGELVYLSEDDIVVEEGCLARLTDALATISDAALVGPLMLNDGAGTVRFSGARVAIGSELKHSEPLAPAAPATDEPFDTDFLPGASMLARASLLREFGGFREDFFMYCEDVELCARIRRTGRRILLVPRARVRHIEPIASGSNDLVDYHSLKNVFFLHVLHADLRALPVFLARFLRFALTGARHMAFRVRLSAVAAALFSTPRLWRDRRRIRAAAPRREVAR